MAEDLRDWREDAFRVQYCNSDLEFALYLTKMAENLIRRSGKVLRAFCYRLGHFFIRLALSGLLIASRFRLRPQAILDNAWSAEVPSNLPKFGVPRDSLLSFDILD